MADLDDQALANLSPAQIRRILQEFHACYAQLACQGEELRETQEALAASRARYEEVYDLAPVGYLTLDGAGLIVEANRRAAAMLATPQDELISQPLSRFICSLDQGGSYAEHRCPTLAAGEPYSCDLNLPGEALSSLWVRLDMASTQSAADGSPLYRVVLTDISEYKQTEKALRHSHELMNYIIAHNQSSIAVYDREMRYIYVGKRYLDGYRARGQEVIGQVHYEVFPGVPEKWREAHQRALAGEVLSAEEDFYVRDDGSVEWIRWECRPWYEANGAIGGIVLYTEDITKRKQAETLAQDLNRQLSHQERLAAIGQLAAGIAHDFNNILAVIALQIPMLGRSPEIKEQDRARLNVIQAQITHATRLIQQIVDFSRRAVLERRPTDLAPFLQDQVNLLTRTLPETIRVSLVYDPGQYVASVDLTRMQQMVMNLAVNARDAMPRGGCLHLTLTYHLRAPRPDLADGAWIGLTVADSGSGISADDLPHIFEPFFTTKPPGQGSGLGLAQVHGIVKQHGGEIEVQSTEGQGTIFSVYLPAVFEKSNAHPRQEAKSWEGEGQTILIVEDNPALLDALQEIVEMLGYSTATAQDGFDALTILAGGEVAVDLILSDLVMPGMGGEDLLAAVRAHGLAIPMVILSGHPLEGQLAELTERGLAGWLLKPVEIDLLSQTLNQILAH